LYNVLRNRTKLLETRGRWADAVLDIERALDVAPPADRLSLRIWHAFLQAHTNSHAQAVAEAIEAAADKNAQPNDLFSAARICSLACEQIKNDPTQLRKYADQAITFARQAANKGACRDPRVYRNLLDDKDFASLRAHPDFQAFVAELEQSNLAPKAK
jgi:hypothetical protein